jgi:hypothetical protein
MKRYLSIILSIAFLFSMFTFSHGAATVPVKSINFQRSSIKLSIGRTYSLKVAFIPANTTQNKLTFTSLNKKVASVDSTGKVKALTAGKVEITATCTANSKITSKCTLTVIDPLGSKSKNKSTNLKQQLLSKYPNPDFRGEISKISGNKITVKVIKANQLKRDPNKKPKPSGSPKPKVSGSLKQKPSGSTGKLNPSLQTRNVEYTGEVLNITINSTLSLISITGGNNAPVEKKITVKDLKVGQIVQLWYKNSSKKEFSRMLVNINVKGQGKANKNN